VGQKCTTLMQSEYTVCPHILWLACGVTVSRVTVSVLRSSCCGFNSRLSHYRVTTVVGWFTPMCLSPCSVIWYRPRGGHTLLGAWPWVCITPAVYCRLIGLSGYRLNDL